MRRPDIEEWKRIVEQDCCGRHDFSRWCESWGCDQVYRLIKYVEYLEARYPNKPVEQTDVGLSTESGLLDYWYGE